MAVSGSEAGVSREQGRAECFSQHNVSRIVG